MWKDEEERELFFERSLQINHRQVDGTLGKNSLTLFLVTSLNLFGSFHFHLFTPARRITPSMVMLKSRLEKPSPCRSSRRDSN